MARPSGPKERCGGRWTEARYRSFIQSLLRQGTRRWAPTTDVKNRAKVARGQYKCECCGEIVGPTRKDGRRRVHNIFVDHIDPIVDPAVGFEGWDKYIERMFCEADNLQLICKDCHDTKSAEERAVAVERRRKEKENK